jgi:anti-anti-sigma factor
MLNVVVENSGNLAILRCRGKIVEGEEVSTLFDAVISLKNKRVAVLDMTRVSRIDARGLGILVLLARAVGVKLQLNPSKIVQELLDLTGLHALFEVRSPENGQSGSDFLADSREDSAIGIAADD